jgi:hypothetical protein
MFLDCDVYYCDVAAVGCIVLFSSPDLSDNVIKKKINCRVVAEQKNRSICHRI